MEEKLALMMLRRTMGYVVLIAFLMGLLTYGLTLLSSLIYAGLTLITVPFNMHAITGKGSLLPITGIVPLSVSLALSQLGVRNIPVVTTLAMVDYKHIVVVVGMGNVTGSTCVAGSIIGIKPGIHLLTSYIRQVTVPALIIVKGNYPFLICGMNYTEALSNVGYGVASMILVPNDYWGRAVYLMRHGINVTIINELNETVNIQYSYLGLNYLINYGTIKPGVNVVNLPLNYYIIYAIINNTPVPIGEAPRELTMIVRRTQTQLMPTRGACSLVVNNPQGAEVVISNGSGWLMVIKPSNHINVSLPCGQYTVAAYEGGEFFSTTVNVVNQSIVNITLTPFSGELPGIEGNYAEYAKSYFRGFRVIYMGLVTLLVVALGAALAGVLGLIAGVKMATAAKAPLIRALAYLTSVDYVNKLISEVTIIEAVVMGVLSVLTYLILLKPHVVLVIRQPIMLNPVITAAPVVAVSLVMHYLYRRAVE